MLTLWLCCRTLWENLKRKRTEVGNEQDIVGTVNRFDCLLSTISTPFYIACGGRTDLLLLSNSAGGICIPSDAPVVVRLHRVRLCYLMC